MSTVKRAIKLSSQAIDKTWSNGALVIGFFIFGLASLVAVTVMRDDAIDRERRANVHKAYEYIKKHCNGTRIIEKRDGYNMVVHKCFNNQEYEFASIFNLYLSQQAKLGSGETYK